MIYELDDSGVSEGFGSPVTLSQIYLSISNAYGMDGVDDYFTFNKLEWDEAEDFAVECIFSVKNDATDMVLLGQSNSNSFYVHVNSTGHLAVRDFDDDKLLSLFPINDAKARKVRLQRVSGAMSLIIDGELQDSYASSLGGSLNAVGRNASGFYFEGFVFDLVTEKQNVEISRYRVDKVADDLGIADSLYKSADYPELWEWSLGYKEASGDWASIWGSGWGVDWIKPNQRYLLKLKITNLTNAVRVRFGSYGAVDDIKEDGAYEYYVETGDDPVKICQIMSIQGKVPVSGTLEYFSVKEITHGKAYNFNQENWMEISPLKSPVNTALDGKFFASASNEAPMTYVVAGDSTRSNGFNEMLSYYEQQIGKINGTIVNSAESGMRGDEWLNNSRSLGLTQAINAIPGTGESSVLEWSFGINDAVYGATSESFRATLEGSIDGLLGAKPDLTIVLVSPVTCGPDVTLVEEVYRQVSKERGLKLVNADAIMNTVWGNSDYYQDSTHPNKWGSMRLVNAIYDQIVPDGIQSKITLEEVVAVEPPTHTFSPVVEPNFWSNSTGDHAAAPTWRRLQPLDVEPNFTLRVKHQGNRFEGMFMSRDGVFLEKRYLGAELSDGFRELTIPGGAYEVRFNVSNDGDAYDATSDVVEVEYAGLGDLTILTQDEINVGLRLNY